MKRTALILASLAAGALAAQDPYYNDAQLRLHLNLEKRISKHFVVHLDQQYRINQNVGNFYRGSADIGLEWRVNKHIRLLADYVYIQRKSAKDIWYHRNWYYGALVLREDFHRVKLIYRNKLQFRQGNENSENEHQYKIYDRNKLTVRYDLNKRLSPYVSEEIYVSLNDPQFKGIARTRSQAGVVINLSKSQQIEFYFMYQAFLNNSGWWDQNNNPNPYRRDYIYGIVYGIAF